MILVSKSLKLIYRDVSIVRMLFFSTLLIFSTLYFIYYSTGHIRFKFLTDDAYQPLQFDFICSEQQQQSSSSSSSSNTGIIVDDKISPCQPMYTSGNRLNPSELLIDSAVNKQSKQSDIVLLLSSMLLHGVPIMDLGDYITLSSAINQFIGDKERSQIMSRPSLNERFGNLLNVHSKEIRIVPNNCFTKAFVEHLYQAPTTQGLSILQYDTVEDAMTSNIDNIFAVVEIVVPSICSMSCHDLYTACQHITPTVSIRMHPSSVPDTRNLVWSPVTSRIPSQLDVGEILYFVSGFLSLQVEVQAFLSSVQKMACPPPTNVFANNAFLSTFLTQRVAQDLMANNSISSPVIQTLFGTTQESADSAMVKVPLYMRAFPLGSYSKDAYWRTFGFIVSVAVMLLVSLPAGIIAGLYRKEISSGITEVLSTLPGMRPIHNARAWILASCALACLLCIPTALFFTFTLQFTNTMLVLVPVLLCGVNIGVFAMILSQVIHSPDSVTVALPIIVFITFLPGALYVDLAFDVNRSIAVELAMCVLPPSAAALALRQIFILESLGIAANWNYSAHISETPLYMYSVMLAIDFVVLNALLAIYLEYFKISRIQCARCLGGRPEEEGLLTEDVSVSLHSLSKTYKDVAVLSNLTTCLLRGEVSVLLGANGAGKTTLFRIIAGVDHDYTGTVRVHVGGDEGCKRKIGWCPQYDSLWDLLTVAEHLHIFANSLKIKPSGLLGMLGRLNMAGDVNKFACQLSGGMKRRLLMCLAFAGDPILILLDEVTTSCDCFTRELVRREILSRSSNSSVLVSTHHIDDIDILGQRILFINERFLAFDSRTDPQGNQSKDFEFSTWNAAVKEKFLIAFEDIQLVTEESAAVEGLSKSTWLVPEHLASALKEFLLTLEHCEITDWEVKNPNIFNVLSKHYSAPPVNPVVPTATTSSVPDDSPSEIPKFYNYTSFLRKIFVSQVFQLFRVRYLELKSRLLSHLFINCFIPFMIAFMIGYFCADVPYPRLLLSSSSFAGSTGEIIGASYSSSNAQFHPLNHSDLSDVLHTHINWKVGNSDSLFQDVLGLEYYNHSLFRSAAFVANDEIGNWIQNSIYLPQSALQSKSAAATCTSLIALQATYCQNVTASSILGCNMVFNITEYKGEPTLAIFSAESLQANVTLMINATSEHAAPVYLKELVPPVYSGEMSQKPSILAYNLYNYPLPIQSHTSSAYLTRGYVGSNMVLLFILLISVVCVKTIIQFKSTGVKLQLHLAGVQCVVYWIVNACCDIFYLIITFLCIYVGIICGGLPISIYFCYFSLIAMKALLCYAAAITASSYATCSLTTDVLSGQLSVLISNIVFGFFIKMFIDRQNGELIYQNISNFLLFTSPSYTFTSLITKCFMLYLEHLKFIIGASDKDFKVGDTLDFEKFFNIMLGQFLVYMSITIFVDVYWDFFQVKLARHYLRLKNRLRRVFLFLCNRSRSSEDSTAVVDIAVNNPLNWARKDVDIERLGSLNAAPNINFRAMFPNPRDATESSEGQSLSSNGVLVKAENVTVLRNRYKTALHNFNFRLDYSDRVAVLGKNGSGKSTLFKMLSLSDNFPVSGKLSITNMNTLYNRWKILRSQTIGYVPQEGGLLEFVTAADAYNIFTILKHCNRGDRHRLLPSKYLKFGIASLSGGNKKKLAVDLALLGSFPLLLLDEVTSGIDPVSADKILAHLQGAKDTVGMLFSSHRIDECLSLCKRVAIIEDGTIVYEGSIASFDSFSHNFLQIDVFLTPAHPSTSILTTLAEGSSVEGSPYRTVCYGEVVLRITWLRRLVNFVKLWNVLSELEANALISRFNIRQIEMEELFAHLLGPVEVDSAPM